MLVLLLGLWGIMCNVCSNCVLPLLSLLLDIKLQTTQLHNSADFIWIPCLSFQLILLKGNYIVTNLTGLNFWSFHEYWAGIKNSIERQSVLMISCHLLCISCSDLIDVLYISHCYYDSNGNVIFSLKRTFSCEISVEYISFFWC